MAGMATRMLLALIDGEALETNRVELSTSLVIRQSTRSLTA
jgi:LacI family transcriptional regulator